MAWKWFKNDWSIAGFLLFFAQLAWAMYVISIVIYPIIFLLGTFGMLFGVFGTEPHWFFDLPAQFEIQYFAELAASSETSDIFEEGTRFYKEQKLTV